MSFCVSVFSKPTCSSALLAVAKGGRADRPQAKALSSLLTCCITCLIGMPQLLTVVTELCTTALPATCDLRTTGTPKSYDCIPGGRQT